MDTSTSVSTAAWCSVSARPSKDGLKAMDTHPGIDAYRSFFFIGIAGTGMSALAQFLHGLGRQVSGSDRGFQPGRTDDNRLRLERMGIRCHPQDGEGITPGIDCVVVSTAVEDSVPEYRKARDLGIPVLQRSELLSLVTERYRTIAVGGTSGKSTTTAMVFDILRHAGLSPSIISGAGLTSLIREGRIGNACVGEGEWLVIEADESDGSIVRYHPELGLLLNIDKDHKEVDELLKVFGTFRAHSTRFIVNRSQPLSASLSSGQGLDFGLEAGEGVRYLATDFRQEGFSITFRINGAPFRLQAIGRHSMENALAAAAAAHQAGVPLEVSSEALASYEGIHRRHQVLGRKGGVWVVDDYAHNPVKCARSIQACQPVADKVVAWLQPHGYGPTRFLRADFVREIAAVLRPQDEIWMSEIFYAGGTAVKDISAGYLVRDLQALGAQAFFVEDRSRLADAVRSHLTTDCVLLLMGARDPSLEAFARSVYDSL
jgi:UDP-N-acetylmuramate--alanine ligase